jgi:hypothetical protein
LFLYKKRKTKEKEKDLHGLGSADDKAGLTARIQPRLRKKSPPEEAPLGSEHFASGTLIYFKNY